MTDTPGLLRLHLTETRLEVTPSTTHGTTKGDMWVGFPERSAVRRSLSALRLLTLSFITMLTWAPLLVLRLSLELPRVTLVVFTVKRAKWLMWWVLPGAPKHGVGLKLPILLVTPAEQLAILTDPTALTLSWLVPTVL